MQIQCTCLVGLGLPLSSEFFWSPGVLIRNSCFVGNLKNLIREKKWSDQEQMSNIPGLILQIEKNKPGGKKHKILFQKKRTKPKVTQEDLCLRVRSWKSFVQRANAYFCQAKIVLWKRFLSISLSLVSVEPDSNLQLDMQVWAFGKWSGKEFCLSTTRDRHQQTFICAGEP